MYGRVEIANRPICGSPAKNEIKYHITQTPIKCPHQNKQCPNDIAKVWRLLKEFIAKR